MNNIILNRLFTIAAFQNIVDDSNYTVYKTILHRYIHNSSEKTNEEAISELYNYMRLNYRNQYYYKNTILNKLLLGVHSINTTTALTEIPISSSKADFVLINGKATVYEIKTELDNLERLESQLMNYYKAFDHVCVLTCEDYAQILLDKYCDSPVGIYVLSKSDTIQRIKEPTINQQSLNMVTMFKILNKPEYEELILNYYGYLPNVSQVKYYSKCMELFVDIPLDDAYKSFLKVLKKLVGLPLKAATSWKRLPSKRAARWP